ncbi:MAG: hypothetical protein QOJ09_1050 [Actinomycetota bacterium]|nr:hypothetical protein [Actinomycetota bacterium]
MTRIPSRRLAAFGLTAGLTLGLALGLAAPAWADETPPARLDQLKARADQKVKDRLTQLGTLDTSVAGAAADCGHNADLRAQLAADKAGLTALDATIQAETDRAKAVVEYRQIFTDYRVYWLETPKTREVVGCARVAKAAGALTAAETKIQARVDEAKSNGKDVAAAQAALDDMTAKTSAATSAAKSADSSVIGLHADKGDRAVAGSNRTTLQAGRTNLRTALSDLQAARSDARKAIDALKSS